LDTTLSAKEHFIIGQANMALDRDKTAIDHFSTAVRLSPPDSKVIPAIAERLLMELKLVPAQRSIEELNIEFHSSIVREILFDGFDTATGAYQTGFGSGGGIREHRRRSFRGSFRRLHKQFRYRDVFASWPY